jgi:DNA-directed RNA polymerase alpha subunit
VVKPKGTLRACRNGHQYYKSSDCPTCPICEKERAQKEGFLAELSAPARRALENAGIRTLKQLAGKSEKEILNLHGIGPSSIPKLKKLLKNVGFSFIEL